MLIEIQASSQRSLSSIDSAAGSVQYCGGCAFGHLDFAESHSACWQPSAEFSAGQRLRALTVHRARFVFRFATNLIRCSERVHVCPKECVAFVGEHSELASCPRCHSPRFDSRGRPQRVFLYLPVVQQLRSLFACADSAQWVRWAGEHVKTPGVVRDITESPGWQTHAVDAGHFNDIRNVALAFCADGINPFGKSAHSTWPLMLSVLNFPPHLRTRPDLMILLGVIPGPRHTKNINLYIGRLVNELVTFGLPGIWLFDA